MRNHWLNEPDDIKWLNDTHLKGVTLPTKWKRFKCAIIQGNEDSPYAVNLYIDPAPRYDDDYLRVTFQHAAPVYCEYYEYDGKTDKPK